MSKFKVRAWDKSSFDAATLDGAKAIVRSHLRQWMDPDDRLHWCEMKRANGGNVFMAQVLDSVQEPTDVIACIYPPDEVADG